MWHQLLSTGPTAQSGGAPHMPQGHSGLLSQQLAQQSEQVPVQTGFQIDLTALPPRPDGIESIPPHRRSMVACACHQY